MDINQTAYIILNGKISLHKNIDGLPTVLSYVGKGEWVGDIALTRKTSSPVTARAVDPPL